MVYVMSARFIDAFIEQKCRRSFIERVSRTDFVVNASLQLAHRDPALLLLHLRVVV